jgi:hypothetical protein
MTVKTHVGTDENGVMQEPVHSYKRANVRFICENLWCCFHVPNSNLYALITNPVLQGADIDVDLLTNRGIGFLELKRYFGANSLHLEGVGSSRGTFINNGRVETPTLLDSSQYITLRGLRAKSCEPRFSRNHPRIKGTGELLSRISS